VRGVRGRRRSGGRCRLRRAVTGPAAGAQQERGSGRRD
jgi:hypothetical protein